MTVVSGQPMIDPELRLNTFCHAVPGLWYTMGAILNGGMALRWWRRLIVPVSLPPMLICWPKRRTSLPDRKG